jgi:hypothetical protein
MTTTVRAAASVVRLAVLLLPAGPVRERYTDEVLAELTDLPPAARMIHALGFLRSAPALRRAVVGVGVDIDAPMAAFGTPLHCRLHLWHHFRTAVTEDGQRYRRCADCGEDSPYTGNGQGDWLAPADLSGFGL